MAMEREKEYLKRKTKYVYVITIDPFLHIVEVLLQEFFSGSPDFKIVYLYELYDYTLHLMLSLL